MFDEPYELSYKGNRQVEEGRLTYREHKLTFKDKSKLTYIVNVEEYPLHVYAVKFHLKNHSDSQKKYHLLTHRFDASRVIATSLEAMMYFLKKDELASFGFVGTHLENEEQCNTKRFRIYRRLIENVFSPVNFQHYVYTQESCYFLLNKANKEPDLLRKIESMFRKHYLFDKG